MKTGAQIVAELEASNILITRVSDWPVVRAALLAYEPKSALRTILGSHVTEMNFSANEIAAARTELDALEQK